MVRGFVAVPRNSPPTRRDKMDPIDALVDAVSDQEVEYRITPAGNGMGFRDYPHLIVAEGKTYYVYVGSRLKYSGQDAVQIIDKILAE